MFASRPGGRRTAVHPAVASAAPSASSACCRSPLPPWNRRSLPHAAATATVARQRSAAPHARARATRRGTTRRAPIGGQRRDRAGGACGFEQCKRVTNKWNFDYNMKTRMEASGRSRCAGRGVRRSAGVRRGLEGPVEGRCVGRCSRSRLPPRAPPAQRVAVCGCLAAPRAVSGRAHHVASLSGSSGFAGVATKRTWGCATSAAAVAAPSRRRR